MAEKSEKAVKQLITGLRRGVATDQRGLMGEERALDYGVIESQMKFLQGKVLTVIDASMDDGRKLKAVKDLVNKAFSEQLTWILQLCNPEVYMMSRDQAESLIEDIEGIERDAVLYEGPTMSVPGGHECKHPCKDFIPGGCGVCDASCHQPADFYEKKDKE